VGGHGGLERGASWRGVAGHTSAAQLGPRREHAPGRRHAHFYFYSLPRRLAQFFREKVSKAKFLLPRVVLPRVVPSTLTVFAARSLERLRFLAESVSFAGDASPPPPASLSDMVVSYRYCRHPRVSKTKLACSPAKRGKGFPGDRASRLVAAGVAA